MPWREKWERLSKCQAEWLDKNRFFNPGQPFFDKRPNIEMNVSEVDAADSRLFQFTVADADGIHQVQLLVPVDVNAEWRGMRIIDCQALDGKEKAVVEFEITDPKINKVELRMIDLLGNVALQEFQIIKAKTSEPPENP